jgi:prepilin-type N-terminal cleavage/methylation domain-containing protein
MDVTLGEMARRASRRAMTLVEVLVTVAIMSILATVVGFAVFQLHVREQKKIARMNASSLRRAAAVWRLNRSGDECPNFARLLADGIIDREASPTDPWGSPYLMTCAQEDVTVLSPGPDRKAGTTDDIVAPPETTVANVP